MTSLLSLLASLDLALRVLGLSSDAGVCPACKRVSILHTAQDLVVCATARAATARSKAKE